MITINQRDSQEPQGPHLYGSIYMREHPPKETTFPIPEGMREGDYAMPEPIRDRLILSGMNLPEFYHLVYED